MKISEITNEMTMRGPNLDKYASNFVQSNKATWINQGQHIADIEDYRVLKYKNYYSLWDNDEFVSVCSLSDSDNVVDDVFISPQYRGRKILSMMLWFFKTRLNKSPLLIGKVHSKDMQEVVNGLSRFNKLWFNVNTHERKPFSTETTDQFYSYLQPTDWRLMLENSGNFGWSLFKDGHFVTEAYEPYVE
jgi:hypothetical protein